MKTNVKLNELEKILVGLFCLLLLVIALPRYYKLDIEETNVIANIPATNSEIEGNNDFIYLSDIDYIEGESSTAWGSILKDKTSANQRIQVKVNGGAYSFEKGIWAHATSVLVYDLSAYNYDYFTSLIGLNTTSTGGNGVIFRIYTSEDKTNWKLEKESVKLPQENTEFVKIDIRGKKYLKLEANDNVGNGQDHSVYADAKLTTTAYEEAQDVINLEKYNEKITNYGEIDLNNQEQEQTLLQRDLIKNAGEFIIKRFIEESAENKETFEWLMNELEALRYYVTGGKPAGNYWNSLKVLTRLYTTYKEDLKDTTTTQYTVLGNLYKRMMISLSLTHSAGVCLWIGGNQCSDAVVRYEIYKKMRAENLLENKVFETLNIEEMRWVMNNNIDDEEIEWLNHHIRRYNKNTDPYQYIVYRFGYNYNLPQYYDAANYNKWNEKYHLSQYNITYQSGKPKLWIVFEQGSVCGGLSKTGSNINGSLGNPSAVIGQPGHAAYLEYVETADGQGMWSIKNDVSGWTQSEKSERLLCGWGSNNWDSYYQVSYVPYAQEALNDIDNYNKALETMLVADLYQNDIEKLEQIYRKALEIQNINMDAWYGLIRTYQRNTNKTAEDYIELAKELTEKMYYFPLPMWDLMKLINGNLQNTKYYATYTNYLRMALEKGRVLGTEAPINQPSITRTMANYLLGREDYTIASFSFDGARKNEIVLGSKYEGNGVRWDYSLDGGTTWKATSENSVLLSQEEIESITEEKDIKIHIVGVNYSEENIYTINITKSGTPTHLFGNDLENRVIGINTTYEWRKSENDAWTSYAVASPDNSGNAHLEVRIGATGTRLPSDVLEFNFTEDNQPETRKYVSISHLSIAGVSSEATSQGRRATNAIDGNYNTNWHSAWNGSDTNRFITIKLDKPRYISAVEFVPGGGGNGKIIDGTVYGSVDGENWEVLSSLRNLRYSNQANSNEEAASNTKSFEIENPKEVQYIKIVADRATNGNWFMAREFNVFQDLTKNPRPTAGVGYDKTEKTNQDVIARLINPSTNITITNNGGSDTYVFKENGEFTFEFVDENGNAGSTTARVDWIDKVAPTATIEYSTTNKTNRDVVARLVPNEAIIVLNNGELNLAEYKDPLSYTFTENGEFTFEFKDEAGNIGHATAKVDWINKEIPIPEVSYSTMEPTNQSVTATLTFEKENVTITNNNGSNTYTFVENGEFTFEYTDEYGNMGTTKVSVDWIDKEAPTATITYSKTDLTNEDVIATIKFNEANVLITNNNGSNTYIFVENGEFTFEYKDKAGNIGVSTAHVNWIDKQSPIVKIEYSTTELTNQNVVAKVISNKDIIITNNSSNIYTFKENGEFTFKYKDKAGNTGSIKAVVDWIDKVAPTATIQYSITELTNQNVIAELIPSEEIVVTNNNGQTTYTFEENDEFTFEFKDLAGNTANVVAKVNWIDKVKPNGVLTYDRNELTNQNVTVTITFDKENVVVTNNHGSNTYTFTENGEFTFEYLDEVGNKNTTTARVDWIDKNKPIVKVNYSNISTTRDPVTATIECDKEIIITNNNGSNKYTFDENGEFTFEYVDLAGNVGSTTVVVDWINKNIANAIITYDRNELTNQNVTASVEFDKENVTITNNEGLNTYTFIENGKFTFEYIDEAGNIGHAIAVVNWIDKEAPTATFKFNHEELTNQDVVVELIPSEEVIITNNDGQTTYTFEENGIFTFEFRDLAGNVGSATVEVNWIDKVAPIAKITYDKTDLTNENVIANIEFDKENVVVTNNEGLNTYTFVENGEFTFEYRDAAGNTGTIKAVVNWIDKEAPTAEIKYNITELTNQNVTVEIIPNEEVTILNNNGLNTYTFTENGEFIFELRDKAGNIGYVTTRVNWIDKTAPAATIHYNINSLTNQSVVAEISSDEEIIILNNNGQTTYTFEENGEFTFEYRDKLGNTGTATAKVTWIDKNVPNGQLSYDISTATNQNVTVTITFDKENVVVTNNGGSNTYTFTENGEFTFEYVDAAGNKNTTTASVDWINKNLPTPTITYNIDRLTNQNVTATITFDKENVRILNNNGLNSYTFNENGEFTFEYVDQFGNIGTYKAIVDWIDKIAPIATITYDKETLTNQNVTATITFNKENVEVINNNGSNSYTFEKNGEITFEYRDEAGNVATSTASVSWIDKIAPIPEIKYNITELTNQDVIASIEFDKDNVTITNNNGLNTYIFEENGEFTFEYVDEAGNKGTAKAEVNWIKKEQPIAKITYNIKELTNQDVIATIELKDGVYVTNNDGQTTYTFTENGEFTFEYCDKAGNVGKITASVDWIDKKVPTSTIIYDITKKTYDNVTAAITFDKPDVIVINNNGSNKYTFTENGEFIFEFKDKAGNKGTAKAEVNWIEKKIEKPIIIPEKKNEDQIIIKNNPIFNYSNQESQTKYTDYTITNIKVSVLTSDILTETKLKKANLTLSDSMKQKFGDQTEYYELYIEDSNGKRKNVNSENVKVLVNINSDKVLKGIYIVRADNTYEELDYKLLKDTQAEFNVKSLGKFLIAYEELAKEQEKTEEIKEKSNIIWYVSSALVLILGILIAIMKKKGKI